MAVERAVSAVEGREPDALRSLSDVLDPAALDALFAPGDGETPRIGGRVEFVYSSCRVTVDDGEYLTARLLDPRLDEASPREPDCSGAREPSPRDR